MLGLMRRSFTAVGPSPAVLRTASSPAQRERCTDASSASRQDAFDELLHCGDEAVRVIRVLGEAERVVAAEHQVALQRGGVIGLVCDVLQRLLDAEAARVSPFAGAMVGFLLAPVGEAALA